MVAVGITVDGGRRNMSADEGIDAFTVKGAEDRGNLTAGKPRKPRISHHIVCTIAHPDYDAPYTKAHSMSAPTRAEVFEGLEHVIVNWIKRLKIMELSTKELGEYYYMETYMRNDPISAVHLGPAGPSPIDMEPILSRLLSVGARKARWNDAENGPWSEELQRLLNLSNKRSADRIRAKRRRRPRAACHVTDDAA